MLTSTRSVDTPFQCWTTSITATSAPDGSSGRRISSTRPSNTAAWAAKASAALISTQEHAAAEPGASPTAKRHPIKRWRTPPR